jgi:hypothetical protein
MGWVKGVDGMRLFLTVLASSAMLIGSASAAVSTTCAETTSCTLAELAGGGTITVNGVTFAIPFYDDFGAVGIDASSVVVTGSASISFVALDFSAVPSLGIAGDTFSAFDFDLTASVATGSPVTLTGAALSAQAGDLAITDEALAIVSVDIGGALLEAFDDFEFGEVLGGSTGLGAVTMVTVLGSVGLEGFSSAAAAQLSGFRLSFDIDGAPIPVPAAFPLFLAGLGIIAARRRR